MLEWTTVRYSTGEFVMGVFTAKQHAAGVQRSYPRPDDAVSVDGAPERADRNEEPRQTAGQALQEALLPA